MINDNDDDLPLTSVPANQPPSNVPVVAETGQVFSQRQLVRLGELTTHNVAQVIDHLEARAMLWKALRKKALQQTNMNQWRQMGDNMWPERAAVSAICNFLGAEICPDKKINEETVTDSKGMVVYYDIGGTITWQGQTQGDIGCASTRDQFFAQRTRKNEETGKDEKYLLPLEEIDRQDIKRKAVTNLYARLLCRIFPTPSKTELEEALGKKVEKSISYAKGTQGGSTDSAETKNMRVALGNAILALGKITGEDGPSILRRLTAFTTKEGKQVPGKDSLNAVTEKQLPYTLKAVQKELAENEPPEDK